MWAQLEGSRVVVRARGRPRSANGREQGALPPDVALLQEQRVYRGSELRVYGGGCVVRRPRGDLHRVRGRLARHDGRLYVCVCVCLASSSGSQATVCPRWRVV